MVMYNSEMWQYIIVKCGNIMAMYNSEMWQNHGNV